MSSFYFLFFFLLPCASASTAILQNSCTAALINPVTLLYLSNISPTNSYVYYSYSYLSTASSITLTMAFRQDPSYWALDDISVTLSAGGPNLVQNPGFETGTLNGYYAFCNPSSSSAAGTVTGSNARSGTYCYYDGSVGNPDYLSQTMAAIPNTYYTISFWLWNLGGPSNSATVIVSG